MDKAKICVTRTVTLAKKCNKKQNLLVFEKNDPCLPRPVPRKEIYTVQPLTSPAAKKIRVCTGADLKRMCPPKLCDCPPMSSKVGIFGHVFRLLGFGLKGILAGSILYWTYDIGLWGPPDDTEQIYKGVCKVIQPTICPNQEENHDDDKKEEKKPSSKKKLGEEKGGLLCAIQTEIACKKAKSTKEDCCSAPPSIENTSNRLKNTWNCFVTCTFDFLANAPERIGDAISWIGERYDKLVNPDNGCDTKAKDAKTFNKDRCKHRN